MHGAKGDRFVRANELPVRQCKMKVKFSILVILPHDLIATNFSDAGYQIYKRSARSIYSMLNVIV